MYVAEEASFRPGEPELICGLTSPTTSESEIVANETFILETGSKDEVMGRAIRSRDLVKMSCTLDVCGAWQGR
jgi:hypothetical protein